MMGDLAGSRTAHICVDVQNMFADHTRWHAPWLSGVLPAIEALADRHPDRTIFTRFIPPVSATEAKGAWREYFSKWSDMTLAKLPSEMIDLVPSLAKYVPPATVVDKAQYSPWFSATLIHALRTMETNTVVVTGGETDVCVLATVMGAIDHGLRVILPTDAVFGSADETHDAMLRVFESRFSMQLVTCTTQDLLDDWKE